MPATVLPFVTDRRRPSQLSGSEWLAQTLAIESLTIAPDALPGHYIANARIADLQPMQMVAAIIATEARIRLTHPHATRTGWRAASDGLRIYFAA